MKTITLEEHSASPGFSNGPGKDHMTHLLACRGVSAETYERLMDIREKRIAVMDAAGIDMPGHY